jgi:hypothetical protein
MANLNWSDVFNATSYQHFPTKQPPSCGHETTTKALGGGRAF